MVSKFKIDEVLIFLLLSLALTVTFVGDLSYFFPVKNEVFFKNFTKSEFVLNAPKQGVINENDKFSVYNNDNELFYSIDGGKTYKLYSDESILSLRPNILFNYQTSIRQSPVNGKFFTVISVLVKSKHKK